MGDEALILSPTTGDERTTRPGDIDLPAVNLRIALRRKGRIRLIKDDETYVFSLLSGLPDAGMRDSQRRGSRVTAITPEPGRT